MTSATPIQPFNFRLAQRSFSRLARLAASRWSGFCAVLAVGVFFACSVFATQSLAQNMIEYPKSKTVDQVDMFFSTEVADPYRWLEEDVRNSEDVKQWVEAQNEVTQAYLAKLPYRKEIEDRLTRLWDFEKYRPPTKRGDKYYFYKNDGLQNQYVLYQSDTYDGEATVFIDPNTWSDDGTVALGSTAFSDDGKLVAYGVQDAGSDWRTWKIMDVASGEVMADELKWLKFGGISWNKDGKSFFYSRYDQPAADAEFQSLNLGQKIYLHGVGTAQSEDQLIHSADDNPEWGFLPEVTEDGKYLIVTIWQGTDDRYRIMYKPLGEDHNDAELKFLIDNFENEFSFIGNDGDVLYFKSDFEAPKKCIIAIDLAKPEKANWKVIVPEADEAMVSAGMIGDYIVAEYLKDAKTQVNLFKTDGQLHQEVSFPGIGSASGFSGKRDSTETFYSFSSFNRPPSIYRYDIESGQSQLIRKADVDFDGDDFEVSQIFYDSKDGTKVPMFIAHKKGLALNGKNPTLLYGYGGFNISLTPGFSISRLQWMEMGGVFAMPNLRGGGEYGKDWHKAGTKTNKQNVFNDFIAAAQWLIANKYTSPGHLAIQGGSNGGLLVGACMTQRPDLFGACLPAVGVMDMLRFQKFTAGRFWVDDYGDADKDQAEFESLYKYSPYHNLKSDVAYPPTMVTTADTDDRVVPGHSFKFAAKLQESGAASGANPLLIRIETKAGHGSGKPTSKIIEEVADLWAFLAFHLELEPKFE